MGWMRVLSTTMVLMKWVIAMKPWCVGLHCVVIQSLHNHPTMCAPQRVWIEMCDWSCMTNDVCVVVEGDWRHLWLVAWLCHPHLCLFVIHHKWHSPHIPTFCCTTSIGWQEDLVTCHHAFVRCFVTTPFPFHFSNHNCLLLFLKPPFLLTSTSSWMLGGDALRWVSWLQQATHHLSSRSSGWWFGCFNFVKSQWNGFSYWQLFV